MANEALQDDEEWGTITSSQSPNKENEIEIELESEGEEVSDETSFTDEEKPDQKPEPAPETKKELDKELDGIETNGAQKRIRRLVAQRNEERSEKEKLAKRLQEYEEKQKELQRQLLETKKQNLESTEEVVSKQLTFAEKAYKQALESGDTDQIVDAQKSLYDARLKLDRISQDKSTYVVPEEETKPVAEAVVDTNEKVDFDPKAIAWAQKNKHFGKDEIFTATAININNELIEEGWDAQDDDFYEEIDRQLKTKLPMYYQEEVKETTVEEPEVKAPKEMPSQVVAGASRTVSNPATGRNKKVKLTNDDILQAKRLGISLEAYARNKVAIETADSNDGYVTIDTSRRGG